MTLPSPSTALHGWQPCNAVLGGGRVVGQPLLAIVWQDQVD